MLWSSAIFWLSRASFCSKLAPSSCRACSLCSKFSVSFTRSLSSSCSWVYGFVAQPIIGDKELYGEELNNYLNCLSPKIGIIVGDFCYSGFLQDDLFRSNFIVISSAGKNEIADGFNGQTFGFYFAEGLKLNLSIGKVFDYARNKHKEKYHGKRRWGMNHTPIIHSLLNPDFIKIR